MRLTKTLFAATAALGMAASASAATTFLGGDLLTAGNWTNGLPASGNVGTVAVDGTISASTFGFGAGSIVDQTAGTITGNINMLSGTWNLQDGTLSGGSFKSNASSTVLNLLGGTVTASGHVGTANDSSLTVGGTVAITSDSLQLHNASPSLNFQSDWTGSWDTNSFSYANGATSWEELFTLNTGSVTYNGSPLATKAEFDAVFKVTGTTLTAVPEPSSAALLGLGGLALILRRRK